VSFLKTDLKGVNQSLTHIRTGDQPVDHHEHIIEIR
jgi:hypothetical protein